MRKIIELSDPVEGATHCLLLNKEELELLAFLVGNTAAADNENPKLMKLVLDMWHISGDGLEQFYDYEKPKYGFAGAPSVRIYTR